MGNMPDGVSESPRKASILAVFWVLLLLSFLAAVFGLLSFAVRDVEPPDDEDLILESPAVPDRLNGYQHLIDVQPITDQWSLDARERVEELNAGPNPDIASAREMLRQGREILEAFRLCCSKPRFQVPDGQWLSNSSLSSLAALASLQATVLLRDGEGEEAFDLAMDIIQLGDRIQRDGKDWEWMVGCSLKRGGYSRLQALLWDCHLGADRLAAFADELSRFTDAGKVFEECNRRKYSESIRLIDQVWGGEKHVSWITGTCNAVARFPLASKLLLKPNRTKEKLAADCRRRIRNSGLSYMEMDLAAGVDRPDKPWWANITNHVGEMVDYPLSHHWLSSLCESRFLADGTRLLFALRAFQSSRGRFPHDLGELVPEFINEVPADPFDGREIRYCPEAEIIYSVGEDLIDSGGNVGARDWREPTIHFGFRTGLGPRA